MAPHPSAPAARSRGTAPGAATAPAPGRRAWLITALIVAFMVVNYADKSVLGLAAVPIMDELGLSNSTYGLISSSFFFLFSLSGLVVGFFSARISSRALLCALTLLWAVAQLPVLVVAAVPPCWPAGSCSAPPRARPPPCPCTPCTSGSRPGAADCPRPCRSAARHSARSSRRPS